MPATADLTAAGACALCPPPPRRAVWEVLGRCHVLGPPNSQAMDRARTRFIEGRLLPALNRQDEDGW